MNYLVLHKPELAIVTYRELLGYTKVSRQAPYDDATVARLQLTAYRTM